LEKNSRELEEVHQGGESERASDQREQSLRALHLK
jgi:hypothetical protein